MKRAGARTVLFTAAGLALNLVSGAIVARALGPANRGSMTAILNAPNFVSWLVGMGAAESISYMRAKNQSDGPSLLATWLLLLIPLTMLGTIILEIALPYLLASQSAHTLELARIFAPMVGISILSQIIYGATLGAHDYRLYNHVRILPWIVVTGSYIVLWPLGELTVLAALLVNLAAFVVMSSWALHRLHRDHGGFARPRRALTRATLLYGIKAHGANVGLTVNARLDVLIIPAFLGATSVGLYSVGTNVSWMIVLIAGSIAPIVLPAAAKVSSGKETVTIAVLMTSAIAVSLSLALLALGSVAVRIVYGPEFDGAVAPMLILLPGCVAFAVSQVIWSGINATGKPLVSAACQVPGLIITIVGLTLLLQDHGIEAAAIVSTTAYSVVFIASFVTYVRMQHVSVADWRIAAAEFGDTARIVRGRLARGFKLRR